MLAPCSLKPCLPAAFLPCSITPYRTVLYAGFDPLFWLHHCMVDKVLWLFQNNGGQWMGASRYSPFLNLQGDAADISSYGYSYSAGRPIGGSGRRSSRGAWIQASEPSAEGADSTPVATIGSAAGKAMVRTHIQQWTGNYTGYTWSVRFQELDQHQMEEPVHLLVYLKSSDKTVQAIPAQVGFKRLGHCCRLLFCWAGFAQAACQSGCYYC